MRNIEVLFFITFSEEISKVKSIINSKHIKEYKIIACNDISSANLLQEKIQFENCIDYFDFKKNNILFNKAKKWARNWYKQDSVKNINLSYRGINYAEMCDLVLTHYFSELLFGLEIAKDILDKYSPKQIYLSNKIGDPLLNAGVVNKFNLINLCAIKIAKQRGIKLHYLSKEIYFLKFIKEFFTILKTIKRSKTGKTNNYPAQTNKENLLILANLYLIKSITPLISKLKSNEEINPIIFGKTSNEDLKPLNELNINFHQLHSISRKIDYFICFLTFIKLNLKWIYMNNNPKITNYFTYYNINLWSILKEKLRFYFLIHFPTITLYILNASRIIDIYHPKALISMESTTSLSKTIISYFKKNKISNIVLQHGFFGPFEIEYDQADIMAVWGISTKKTFLTQNKKVNKLVVTGSSYFDKYHRFKKPSQKKLSEILKRLRINNNNKIVTVLGSEPFGAVKLFSTSTFQTYYKLFSNLPKNANVLVRSHPSDDNETIYRIASALDTKIMFANHLLLEDLIIISDVIIARPTTALIDAIILKKPVLYMGYSEKMEWKPEFVNKQAVVNITTIENLNKILKSLNKISTINRLMIGRENFMLTYLNGNNGKSSQTISDLVKILIHQ